MDSKNRRLKDRMIKDLLWFPTNKYLVDGEWDLSENQSEMGGGVELPFRGVGKLGYGREKGFGDLYGFSQFKTIASFHR